MKKVKFILFQSNRFGKNVLIESFRTLDDLYYYMIDNDYSICEVVKKDSLNPIFKYRIYSCDLGDFI